MRASSRIEINCRYTTVLSQRSCQSQRRPDVRIPAERGARQAWNGNHRRSPFARFGPQDKGVYTKTGRPEMSQYTVFFAQTATGYSAYVPDLPGCVAAGATLEETRQLIRQAIEFHIEGMRLHGEEVPPPPTSSSRLKFRPDKAASASAGIPTRARIVAADLPGSPRPLDD